MKLIKILFQFLLVLFLTLLTQTGGVIYLLNKLLFFKSDKVKQLYRFLSFISLYLLFNQFLTPSLAQLNNREPVVQNKNIQFGNSFTSLLNRNYVKPELNLLLLRTADRIKSKGITINVLESNFPFLDGFPLIPHLSHNDGKKLDISFIYETPEKVISNKLKSISGYGVFENPKHGEIDQTLRCKQQGFFQYDLAKYLSFGAINNELILSEEATRDLIQAILVEPQLEKLFIEPHLKDRLNLKHSKIRFHGCHAVRHDDHIHIQIK